MTSAGRLLEGRYGRPADAPEAVSETVSGILSRRCIRRSPTVRRRRSTRCLPASSRRRPSRICSNRRDRRARRAFAPRPTVSRQWPHEVLPGVRHLLRRNPPHAADRRDAGLSLRRRRHGRISQCGGGRRRGHAMLHRRRGSGGTRMRPSARCETASRNFRLRWACREASFRWPAQPSVGQRGMGG